jgi:hypothetical protein
VPAKSTKPTTNVCSDPNAKHTRHSSSPLFQLTGPEATTAGPRCLESCPSVDWCAGTCKVDETSSNSLFRPTHTVTVVACSNSQELKRRQLAHGARNRAGQLIFVQVPANSTKTTAIQTKTNASVPTHSSRSNDSWPKVLGSVPVSRLFSKYLQSRRNREATTT